MPTLDITVDSTLSLRQWQTAPNSRAAYQAQFEQHLCGFRSTFEYLQAWAKVDLNWGGMAIASFSKAELLLHTDNVSNVANHKNNPGAAGRENIKVVRAVNALTPAGNGGEENWNTVVPALSMDANYKAYGGPGRNVTGEVAFSIDVTQLVLAWAPKTVKGPGGVAGKGLANNGFFMVASGTNAEQATRPWCVASASHPTEAWQPVLRITFTSSIGPGDADALTPNGTLTDYIDEFITGRFNPPGADITMVNRAFEIREVGSTTLLWPTDVRPVSEQERQSGTFSDPLQQFGRSVTVAGITGGGTGGVILRDPPLPRRFVVGKFYEWRTQIKDSRGVWTPWTAWTPFHIATSPPGLTILGPSGTYSTLNGVRFAATYSDPEADLLSSLRIQVRSTTAPGNPLWDTGDSFWDTGDTTARAAERSSRTISRLYEGEGLLPGAYSFRIRATDRLGGQSNWAYGTFTLTLGYQPRPGETNFLTGYARDRYDWRVRIFGMGVNRGPGKLLAEFVDASSVGLSEMYNSAGEFYFTVPVDHPQASMVEPFQTHWSLEVYRGEGWYPVGYGLMTDYDATDNEAVFYGLDYVGVLSLLDDERFNPTDSPDKPVEQGGSKYSNWRVSAVIKDQLDKAKATPNSPVGFINVAAITPWDEFVTIFSTFKERLSFIAGLIESHRAGTGVRTRLVCERAQNGTFTFRVLDAPGVNRDNIVFEYGGLAQGFHVVPFGQFGTRVHGIGRAVDGTKPYYSKQVAPGIDETVYGSWPQTRLWADIADINDLQRRVKQSARNVAKVGKRVGIGIRVGAFDIKDGWDITDSVKVSIKKGIVDTTRFGSGYWTIWGWQWEWDNNAPSLTLSLLPRDDDVPPQADLLPSAPILDYPEWATGPGAPPAGDSPYDHWLNTDTGDVWSKNPATGVWENTGTISGTPGPPGPPGPEGPEGPPGAGSADTTPPVVPTGLQVETGVTKQTDGSLRPFLRGWWTANSEPDFDHYDVEVCPANLYIPTGWSVVARAATGPPLTPGNYNVGVTGHGPDGGESRGVIVTGIVVGAGQELFLSGLPSAAIAATYGLSGSWAIYCVLATGNETPLHAADTTATSLIVPAGSGTAMHDYSDAINWHARDLIQLRQHEPNLLLTDVLGGWHYAARVQATDTTGNQSVGPPSGTPVDGWAYPTPPVIVTARDGDAPPTPAAPSYAPGTTSVGLRWNRSDADDLDRYQVTYRVVGDTSWVEPLNVYAMFCVVHTLQQWQPGHEPYTPKVGEDPALRVEGIPQSYEFRVRAVDRSGNVEVSPGPPQAIGGVENKDIGWSPSITVTMLTNNTDSLSIETLFADYAYLIEVSAGQIKGGQYHIAPDPTPGSDEDNAILVWNDAAQTQLLGYWSPSGWYIIDHTNPSRAIRGLDGVVSFTANAPSPVWAAGYESVWTPAITPEGFNASLITSGALPGGANRLLNSAFELAPRKTAGTPMIWDTAAEWDAAFASIPPVNKSTTLTVFQQAKYLYTDV